MFITYSPKIVRVAQLKAFLVLALSERTVFLFITEPDNFGHDLINLF